MFLQRGICRDRLQKLNCYGLVGIDYIVTKDKKIFMCECNARYNSSTFPALISKKLYNDKFCWINITKKTKPMSVGNFFKLSKNLLISKSKKSGIFPLDLGLLKKRGEGQFIIFGRNNKELNKYLNKLNNICMY